MTKTTGRRSVILFLFFFILLAFSIGFFAWLKIDANEKQIQLEALNVQLEELQKDNEQVNYYINEADEAELYEHLARERGYVYPDEKVYYNITPGN